MAAKKKQMCIYIYIHMYVIYIYIISYHIISYHISYHIISNHIIYIYICHILRIGDCWPDYVPVIDVDTCCCSDDFTKAAASAWLSFSL